MADFRPCSICLSYSQASLCHCTLQLILNQFELTVAHLRYSLGGDRPSQTTNHTISLLCKKYYLNITLIYNHLEKDSLKEWYSKIT